MKTINIDYFTDTLCIWAYIAQTRMDELQAEFGSNVIVHEHFFPVFGHVQKMIETHWGNSGGMAGYAEHVHKVAARFEHIRVHPDIWLKNTPHSSLPSHLYLSAILLLEQNNSVAQGTMPTMAWEIRKAFFSECRDISAMATLHAIAEENKLPLASIEQAINSGAAFALFSEDMKMAAEMTVDSSPTLIFNEERQRLTGNVGYRIIQANIRELLHNPTGEHSWC